MTREIRTDADLEKLWRDMLDIIRPAPRLPRPETIEHRPSKFYRPGVFILRSDGTSTGIEAYAGCVGCGRVHPFEEVAA